MSQVSFSAHPDIHNKPASWEPRFGCLWQQVTDTLENLRDRVRQGDAFIAAAMSSQKRTTAAFVSSELAVVDIDYGLTAEQLLEHPLAAHACFAYTTPSHDPENGKHRFRVLFRLPQRVTDPDLYKAIVTILTRALGGDEACKDPCRIWYGNSAGEQLIWAPDVQLPGEFIDDAHTLAEKSRVLYDPDAPDADANSIARAIFVLEQIIDPTKDGERDKFVRISAAAKAGGAEVFPAWSDWASRGHHGSGAKSRQSSERWFNGLSGTSLGTLFWFASQDDADWRRKLPDELQSDGSYTPGRTDTYAGYSMEDFMGDPEEAPSTEAIYGLFDPEQPWAKVAKPAEPVHAGHTDADFMGDPDSARDPSTTPKRGPGRPKTKKDPIETVMNRLRNLYPGLRLNLVAQRLEYGPKDDPQRIQDPSTTYVRISRGTGEIFPKTMVTDLMHVVGYENKYNPVTSYLDSCLAREQPCPYFDRLGTELLGLSDDEAENPVLPDGMHLADVIVRRFLIGAVARAFQPGCTMDWMPILIGPQNLGKTTFFNYLSPTLPNDERWVVTLQQGIAQIKERPHILHAGWVVVLDEVERYFKRQYVEELKNLVSVSTDISRRLYQNEQPFARNFVLAGATNNRDIFQDPTGNRRFLPIVVAGKIPSRQDPRLLTIDLDKLKADRDSIWAAAYQAYLDGESWLFTSYELEMIATYIAGFTADSSVEARVEQELIRSTVGHYKGRRFTTLSEICRGLKLPLESQPGLQRAITDTLKRAGWQMKCIKYYGKATRVWLAPSNGETEFGRIQSVPAPDWK